MALRVSAIFFGCCP